MPSTAVPMRRASGFAKHSNEHNGCQTTFPAGHKFTAFASFDRLPSRLPRIFTTILFLFFPVSVFFLLGCSFVCCRNNRKKHSIWNANKLRLRMAHSWRLQWFTCVIYCFHLPVKYRWSCFGGENGRDCIAWRASAEQKVRRKIIHTEK